MSDHNLHRTTATFGTLPVFIPWPAVTKSGKEVSADSGLTIVGFRQEQLTAVDKLKHYL